VRDYQDFGVFGVSLYDRLSECLTVFVGNGLVGGSVERGQVCCRERGGADGLEARVLQGCLRVRLLSLEPFSLEVFI
jgi:hypothetical protein